MTTITLEYLEEPKLQFNQLFEHQDSKTGLAEYGPYGRTIPGLHPSEIKVGFIGTRETMAKAHEWFVACGSRIESEKVRTLSTNRKRAASDADGLFAADSALEPASEEWAEQATRVEKILNRDFVGFNLDSPFHSQFLLNERWDRPIQPREIEALLKIDDKVERIRQLVDLFDSYVESLATLSPSPDIIVLALTQEIADKADAARITGNFYYNFRRAIKARAMRWGVPLQILQWRTVSGTDPNLQDRTLRAWNFCTAQYYKAEGVPWRPASVGRDTCFVATATNIVLLGPPGVGKTHLALAFLGQALEAGYSGRFTTLRQLADELETVTWRQQRRRYLTPRVLVIDEVGYVRLSPSQAQQLFDLVTARYEHGAIILTSNRSFAEWGTLLGDEVLATALLDRLLHHADVLAIDGRSYRMKERRLPEGLPVPAALAGAS